MPRSGSYLGPSLGCRDPDHIARWVAAMNAGKAKLHCTAIAMTTGAPCGRVPLKFADKCSIHCGGAERIEIDQLRLVWLQRKLRRRFFNIRERAALEAQVAKIKRAAALVLSRRYDEETALLKVKRALQAEELWRSKTGHAE
jgi:hypothetical protein